MMLSGCIACLAFRGSSDDRRRYAPSGDGIEPARNPRTAEDRRNAFQLLCSLLPIDNDSAKAAGLTERERSILEALAKGKSNDEIAKELWVTQQTVKFHLTNIYRKLGVKNRTEATRLAYQRGLVENPLYDE